MADRGPPPKKGDPKPFQVTVPKPLFDYLGYLAQHSILGVSENEIASYILRKHLEEMLKTGFHKLDIPKPD
jgi:hypothetical protein